MSENRFEKLFHFQQLNGKGKTLPKEDPNHNMLFEIKSIIDNFLLKNPFILEKTLSINEQMCASESRHSLMQNMPMYLDFHTISKFTLEKNNTNITTVKKIWKSLVVP